MKILIAFTTALVISCIACAQDPFIQLDKEKYQKGDTIQIKCDLPAYKTGGIRYATLYLLIEDLHNQKKWSYRYPIVDGSCNASIVIDSAMLDAKYALNFRVRKSFFSLRGAVESGEQTDMSYALITRNEATIFDNIKTDENGSFSLKGILFQDSGKFVFSPGPKTKQPGLKIDITTPLDSIFVSDRDQTQIIAVGNTEPVTEQDKQYKAAVAAFVVKTTLPDVVVSATRKKKIEQFNEEFSTGLFNSPTAKIFDGLEENKIAQSGDILDFLRGAVAGLRVIPNAGSYVLQWRGISSLRNPTASNVDVFVDEMQMGSITENFMSPGDVAMIKAYPPPAYLSPGGQRGAIAIYTKRGSYENDNLFRSRFTVYGYSAPVEVWK